MHFSKWLIIFPLPLLSFVSFFVSAIPSTAQTYKRAKAEVDYLAPYNRDIFHSPDRYSVLEKIGSYQNIVVTSAAACSKSQQFQAACTASALETVPGSRPQFQGDISIGEQYCERKCKYWIELMPVVPPSSEKLRVYYVDAHNCMDTIRNLRLLHWSNKCV